jgi:L,D-transpeptidase-like protein/putative peptidoglycan binding protein
MMRRVVILAAALLAVGAAAASGQPVAAWNSGYNGCWPGGYGYPPVSVQAAVKQCSVTAHGPTFRTLASVAVAQDRSLGTAPVARHATPMLRLGSRGPAVRALQSSLARLTYLPYRGVDGVFGMQTWHAVVAFQGWSNLARDGIAGARTQAALVRAQTPVPWSRSSGFEIHISQQVLLFVRDGRVQRAIHVSTGANGLTPLGHFRVYRRDAMSWSVQFHVWMPLAQYFYAGYAMHQFWDVPASPASHGCVRVPEAEARTVWQFGAIGTRVWTRA